MTLLSFVVLLGILIFVHEFGHFIFAKLLGVRVLKFSLGFGPKLIGRKYGDTEYLISALPLGGYVKPLGEEPGEEIKEEDKPFAYNYQPIWKRAVIIIAGPVFNLLFAAVLLFLIYHSGIPVTKPCVGKIEESSPAAKAGFLTEDKVMDINGNGIQGWDEIEELLNKSKGRTLLFKLERVGKIIELSVTPIRKTGKNFFGENIETWDIGIWPLLYPIAGEVLKGEVADKAGIKKGDRIIEIEGTAIKTWNDMTDIIHNNPEKSLKLKIKRNENVIELNVTPAKRTIKTLDGKEKQIGLIGVGPTENSSIKKYKLIDAALLGIRKTWDAAVVTILVIIKLIQQRISPTETLGGPIMIAQIAGKQASLGAVQFFLFMAVMSINLGVLNLLPIPILDGGHLMFLTIESIRRKPLSEKIMMIAQRVGLAIIVALMIFVLYNDFNKVVVPWIKKILI